jgi:hypothetical protein
MVDEVDPDLSLPPNKEDTPPASGRDDEEEMEELLILCPLPAPS